MRSSASPNTGPSLYRKLNPPVAAIQWTGDNVEEFREWLGANNVWVLEHKPQLIRLRKNPMFRWIGFITDQYVVDDGEKTRNVLAFDKDIFDKHYRAVGSSVPGQRSSEE